MSAAGGTRAILAAFSANLGIAAAKGVAFALTGSASLLAESVHSLADTGNQGLLLLGGRRARRPPDAQHPFGHARERFFWAFVVSLVLFSLGGVAALYEGVTKLRAPHPIGDPRVAFAVLGTAVAAESFSLRTALSESRQVKRAGQSYPAFIRHTRNPELPVVLLEDVGALLGLAFALVGLVLAEVTGEPRYDAAGSLAIGVLLVGIAAVLARETKSLLIGEAAEPEVAARLREALAGSPAVASVIHLRTLQLGPEDLLVAAKVEMTPGPYLALVRGIDEAERRMRAAVPAARLIFLEPDQRHPPS